MFATLYKSVLPCIVFASKPKSVTHQFAGLNEFAAHNLFAAKLSPVRIVSFSLFTPWVISKEAEMSTLQGIFER